MSKKNPDLKPLRISEVIDMLNAMKLEHGDLLVVQASDEEGNSYSPVVPMGITFHEGTDEMCFYPLLPKY